MLTIKRAVCTSAWALARNFVNENHSYIKWSDRPSRKLYWLLYESEKLVGVFGLGSAFAMPKAIKAYMKEHNLRFNEIGNNIVYCLSSCETKNAGSQFLRMLRKDAQIWWKDKYGDTLKALQTFILPPRTGAMYKADNWTQLGETSGGKTMKMRTLYGADRENYPQAEVRRFKSGEVKYLLREFVNTERKLIFMKLLVCQ